MGVTHTFTNPKADGADATIVRPSDWNATHSFDGQLAFPATQSASANANTLDDYEEGTWTPVLTFSNPGNLSVAYTTQAGSYTKVGRLVTCAAVITTSTFTHTTASNDLWVTGLPFAMSAATLASFTGTMAFRGWNLSTAAWVVPSVGSSNPSTLFFSASKDNAARANITTAEMPTGGTVEMRLSIQYET